MNRLPQWIGYQRPLTSLTPGELAYIEQAAGGTRIQLGILLGYFLGTVRLTREQVAQLEAYDLYQGVMDVPSVDADPMTKIEYLLDHDDTGELREAVLRKLQARQSQSDHDTPAHGAEQTHQGGDLRNNR